MIFAMTFDGRAAADTVTAFQNSEDSWSLLEPGSDAAMPRATIVRSLRAKMPFASPLLFRAYCRLL